MHPRSKKGTDSTGQNPTKWPERGWDDRFRYSRCPPNEFVIDRDGALLTCIVGQYEHDFEAPPIIPLSAKTIPDLQDRLGDTPSAEVSYYLWNKNDEGNLGTGDERTEGYIAGQISEREMVETCTSQTIGFCGRNC
jgi:hypothetical protein